MRKGRKITGGRYVKSRKKKLYERSGQKNPLKLGEERRKIRKTRGGNLKSILLRGKSVNIQDNGKSKKAEIKNVIETPANRFLARQNVITKGTIVETNLGKVMVTNRPVREGVINGILVK